ncbi:uncharacterized protein LOC144006817 [Festucalex cinctus]
MTLVPTSTSITISGRTRKRKIQLLLSIAWNEQMVLPPSPELDNTVTVIDIDEVEVGSYSKTQRIMETPVPEPEKSTPPSTTLAPESTSAASSSLTLSSLVAAPLTITSSTATPDVIVVSAANTTTVSALTSLVPPRVSTLKASNETDVLTPFPASTSVEQPAAFSQVLGQVSNPASTTALGFTPSFALTTTASSTSTAI